MNARRLQQPLLETVPEPDDGARVDPGAPRIYGGPRTLLYVTVKRDNTSWRSLYGHWWLEVDGRESYGWWPATVPLTVGDLLRGTTGVLNAVGLLGMKGTWYRDPNHGQPAMHVFHPVLVTVQTDEQVRSEIRRFAHGYRARWRWHWDATRASGTCRAFQDELFAAVGLVEGRDRLHTRGSGCPFLYHFRRAQWWAADRLEDASVRWRSSAPATGLNRGRRGPAAAS